MTTEERATAYAEKKMCAALDLKPGCINHTDALIPKFCGRDIEEAYEDGATEALASQWRSVEEELPSNDNDVLATDENGLHIASYFNGEWYSTDDDFTRQPQMWMPIPSLPDANTEKI